MRTYRDSWRFGAIGFFFALSGCVQPAMLEFSLGTIDITIVPPRANAETVEPDSPFDIVAYEIRGTGPNGARFEDTTEGGELGTKRLSFGVWNIAVDAIDASEAVVAAGSAEVIIHTGESTSVAISVTPLSSAGAIELEVLWNSNHTVVGTVVANLVDTDGVEQPISWTPVSAGHMSATVPSVEAGYYRLSVMLMDQGTKVAGLAETVRVVADDTTVFSHMFEQMNKVGEEIAVTGPSFSLAWDPPEDGAVQFYRVYARTRGQDDWVLIGDTTTAEAVFEINEGILAYGNYEFAVSTVFAGIESDLHTSMDDGASPATGWYVNWSES